MKKLLVVFLVFIITGCSFFKNISEIDIYYDVTDEEYKKRFGDLEILYFKKVDTNNCILTAKTKQNEKIRFRVQGVCQNLILTK